MPQNEKNAQNLQDLKISTTSQSHGISDTHTHTHTHRTAKGFLS